MSWGDPQTALNLNTDQNAELSSLLLTIAGPSRILLHDPKWQALLHNYNVLVHLDEHRNVLVQTATNSMAKHAARSGNLAALALHCSRMLRDLSRAVALNQSDDDLGIFPMALDLTRSRSGSESLTSVGSASVTSSAKMSRSYSGNHRSVSNKSSFVLIGKARATCGALKLLQIFLHRTILSGGDDGNIITSHNLESAFTYKEQKSGGIKTRDAVEELLSSIVQLISMQGNPSLELYDTLMISISLLLIMISPQLYQPMLSSTQREQTGNFANESQGKFHEFNAFFLDRLFSLSGDSSNDVSFSSSRYLMPEKWEISLLNTIFRWYIQRPEPPKRSITACHTDLLKSMIHSRGETPGPDGLYENHRIVSAEAPQGLIERSLLKEQEHKDTFVNDDMTENVSVISTTTRGVLSISTSLLLIPWRLMRLAISTIGNFGVRGYELLGGGDHWQHQLLQDDTKEVLWLSESPLADLGSCLFLLFCHNQRFVNSSNTNNFRSALQSLEDNRWKGATTINRNIYSFDEDHSILMEYPERQGLLGTDHYDPELGGSSSMKHAHFDYHLDFNYKSLSVNFESLIKALGFTVHTELGSLFLYTMIQSNSNFASALAVRSDLDTVILPLVRTLYFSSIINEQGKLARSNVSETSKLVSDKKVSMPFRSPLSLYLVMINLLLFSQDASFGPDAFRRLMIENISWYKERHLRDISLGSLIILCLLRSMTFNLSRLRDGFLLSNTLAVLLNLTPHASGLHSYTSLRLVSVTLNCMRRYASINLHGNVVDEEDIMSEQGMYGESCRALLQLLNKCISPSMLEKNLHVLYALVYRKAELDLILSKNGTIFSNDLGRIPALVSHAHSLLSSDDEALSAERAMEILQISIPVFQQIDPVPSIESTDEDFTYLYEEEDDPEIFFVPYVWDVVSSVVTPGFIDWERYRINITSTEIEPEHILTEHATTSISSDSLYI